MVTLAGIGGVTGTAFQALRALKAERRETPAAGCVTRGFVRMRSTGSSRTTSSRRRRRSARAPRADWGLRGQDRRPHRRDRPASPLAQCRGEVADRRGPWSSEITVAAILNRRWAGEDSNLRLTDYESADLQGFWLF